MKYLILFFVVLGVISEVFAEKLVLYKGKIVNEKGEKVSGVYPLKFSLYEKEKGGEPLWEEEYFVAVENGSYVIELGRKNAFPDGKDLEKLFISVSLQEGGELVREAFIFEEKKIEKIETPPKKTSITYADTAGYAVNAEHAANAERIGNYTFEDLKKMLLEEGGGKTKIGTTKRYTDLVGGSAGQPYMIMCPKGYIVTGIRGGAGIYVDSIQLICSPIE